MISLVDPCDPPQSITSPGLTNQVYTITDANATPYTHPSFTSDPVYCPIEYTYSETKLSAGDSAISSLGATTEFFYDKDLAPLGQTQTVTVTATSNSIYGTTQTQVVQSDTYELSFLNPCIDTNFVTLTPTAQTESLSDSYTSSDVVFTYNPFTVEPLFCEMTVKCNNVSGPSNVLGCTELSNGKIQWNFTPQDYTTNGLTPGEYTYTFDVSTGDSDPGLTKQFSFKVILIDGCLTPVVA